ncbi:hypothetical protein LTR36_003572 [Oleoguttula mirabilis]|uniref:Apurinic-apyrimidinic endonuclease 1 n=1 Tax=Oleoguttula mirabilis TaxID=1507867 RepID=A0AAV9JIK6_9PEZI|nr:hypothetical protein LTR36_003572 [Oleoguttula mirabilis]
MPKRKLTKQPSAEESDLSPPPDDLLDGEQAVAGANGHAADERPVKRHKAKQTTTQAAELDSAEDGDEAVVKPAKKRTRKQQVKVKVKVEVEVDEQSPDQDTAPKKRRTRKKEVKEEEQELNADGNVSEKKVKKKRQTKAEKEAELVDMPLAARTAGHKLYIGAHVSAAGGVHQAVLNSVHIGANAFALFLKSQRKWVNPPLQDEHSDTFHKRCNHHLYDQKQHVVPHGSYLVNLAHTDKARTEQAYDSFLDDLRRCEKLGITLYNFHPGNVQCGDRPKAIAHLASNINKAHSSTSTVVTLLENMAAGGNVLGSTFEDLRDIIALIDNKDRVGVCLDTCHAFAAGYDLRTPEVFKETMTHFDETVGFKYLKAMHINDSKAPFLSHRDLHANIGTGFLGLRAFHNIVNEPRLAGLPLVLETPIDVRDENGVLVKDEKGKDKEDKAIWAREIKMLESFVGMDVECEEFLGMEKRLARQGQPERKRLAEQIERKREKEEKAATKKKRKGKKEEQASEGSKLSELEDESGSEGEEGGAGEAQKFAG